LEKHSADYGPAVCLLGADGLKSGSDHRPTNSGNLAVCWAVTKRRASSVPHHRIL